LREIKRHLQSADMFWARNTSEMHCQLSGGDKRIVVSAERRLQTHWRQTHCGVSWAAATNALWCI